MKNDSLTEQITPELLKRIKDDPFQIKSMNQTKELCLEAVKTQPFSIFHVNKDLLSFDLLLEAIQNDSKVFNIAKNRFSLGQPEYDQLVEINPQVLRYINEDFIHYKMCIKALKKDPTVYWYIPKTLKLNKKISYVAVKGDIKNLKGDFPLTEFKKYLSDDVLVWLLNNSATGFYGVMYLPDYFISKKIADFVIDKNEHILQFIPKESQTPYNCLKALEQNEKNKVYIKIIENVQNLSTEELKQKLKDLSKTNFLVENL